MLGVISLPFTLFVTDFAGGVLLIALVGASVAGYYLFPYIIYADFANVDEILTGEGRAGFYTSFPSIPLNLMQAFSGFMWGVIFSLPEIIQVPSEPTSFVSQGYLFWGPFAAVFLLLSVLVLFKTNLDPDFESLKGKPTSETIPTSAK
jgi:Na+/melibiose symporter-like transporter